MKWFGKTMSGPFGTESLFFLPRDLPCQRGCQKHDTVPRKPASQFGGGISCQPVNGSMVWADDHHMVGGVGEECPVGHGPEFRHLPCTGGGMIWKRVAVCEKKKSNMKREAYSRVM